MQGNALQNIGEIHFRLGNLDTARPLFDQSREQFEALKIRPATGQGSENDGVLEAREVINLELGARVAVFSDGAAASMRDSAPAAATLRWAWRSAGVPAIVMARWTSEDTASATMLAEWHTRLQSGDGPDVALQEAQRTARAGEATRAPYFWAGWLVIGR